MSLNNSILGREYMNYCFYRNNAINSGVLDLSNAVWFFPSCLLPLGLFMKKIGIKVIFPNDNNVKNYINLILKGNIDSSNKSYIPIIEILPNIELIQKRIDLLISDQINENFQSFNYIISELVDNIYEHSKYTSAFIMVQKYDVKKFIEIAIIDNGISIPGSYERNYLKFSDVVALQKALKGLSTKDKCERGFGLRTSMNVLTNGFNAECLIVSRGASVILTKNEKKFLELEPGFLFEGTFICSRIMMPKKEIDLYNYVE